MNDAEPFDLDRFMPYLLSVLASRLSHGLASTYAERFGITIPEWRLIAHLVPNTKVSVREIHERVDMDKAKVSRAAAQLEGAGIITKRVNPADRRLVELALTRKGRRLFEQIAPLAVAFESQLFEDFTPQETAAFQKSVARLLGKVRKTAEKNER